MVSTIQTSEKVGRSESRRGRPRSADKNSAILQAAGELFMVGGFERTSMDEVARRAGVSKQTVYSHFQNKERLFSACIRQTVADYFPADPIAWSADRSAAETLRMIGRQYLRLIMSADAINMFRMIIGAGDDREKIARLFFGAGIKPLSEDIRAYLSRANEAGDLTIPCVDRACRQLAALLRGEYFLKCTLGIIPPLTDSEIDRHVEECIDAFVKLYGA